MEVENDLFRCACAEPVCARAVLEDLRIGSEVMGFAVASVDGVSRRGTVLLLSGCETRDDGTDGGVSYMSPDC